MSWFKKLFVKNNKPIVYFFGGSFDPWHLGHSYIVEQVRKDKNKKVLIAPACNPWKNKGLLDISERIKLIQELYSADSQVEVLTEGFVYTVEFIEKYATQYNLILVMGHDSFETFPKWKDYAKIKELIYDVKVIKRTPYSSTCVRENLKHCYGQVPANVYNYLLINKVNYKKPSVTVDAIVLNQSGKILVMKRNTSPFKDNWVFPGGFVDEGENPKHAALRELAEETGIDVAPVKIVFNEVMYKKDRDPRDWIISLSYVIKLNCNPEAQVTETLEAKGFNWVTPQELLELEMGFDHGEAAKSAYLNNLLFG